MFSGTCIKDTWTTLKGGRIKDGNGVGWGVGRVGEENGDNCS